MNAIEKRECGIEILRVLRNVSAVSGVKRKEAILKDFAKETDEVTLATLKAVLRYACDNFIMYGITVDESIASLKAVDGASADLSEDFVWETLDRLSLRTGNKVDRLDLIITAIAKLEPASGELFKVILDKDLGCGVSTAIIERVFPKLLTVFKAMKPKPFEARKVESWPVAVEVKYDGMRILSQVGPNDIHYYSYEGNPVPAMESFSPLMRELHQRAVDSGLIDGGDIFWTDAEIISGRDFNDSVSAARKKSKVMEEGRFMIFDILLVKDLSNSTAAELAALGSYTDRRKMLVSLLDAVCHTGDLSIEPAPSYIACGEDEVRTYYANARERGLEGILIKALDAPYELRRTWTWMKMKAKETVDLKVKGAFEGNGQFAGMLGGVIVDYKGVDVECGSGFKAQQRKDLWQEYQKDLARIARDEETTFIGSLIEMEYQEVTPAGSLRLPIFKRRRLDKSEVSF